MTTKAAMKNKTLIKR